MAARALLSLGTAVGSFVNVVIFRLPRGGSLMHPPSYCPHCETSLGWYDLIPIFSFIVLGGKCRYCGGVISWQYPLVEIATGLTFMYAALRFQTLGEVLVHSVFLAVLMAATVIDLQHRIIPNRLLAAGFVLGLILFLWHDPTGWSKRILGVALAGGAFFAVALATRGGLGGGDVKLAALMGFYLGWKKGLLSLFLGSLFGAAAGLVLMLLQIKGRKDYIPFGPFWRRGERWWPFGATPS